jgi:hypothetical protein
MESLAPMRAPQQLVGLWMLAVMAHWAYYYGGVIYYLTRYALRALLGALGVRL